MRPEAYLAHNQQLWEELHLMLAPHAPAPPRSMPYPFMASMLGLLAAELPHIVATAAGGGGAAASPERGGRPVRALWEGRPAALAAFVLCEARAAMGSEVSADTDLMASGLDSLGLIELVTKLAEGSGVKVTPLMLAEHPSPRAAAAHLAELLGSAEMRGDGRDLAEMRGAPLAGVPHPAATPRGELEGAPPAARPVARHHADVLPRRQLVLPDEPRLLLMREGAEGEPLLVMLPSNFGTVLDRLRLARALPAEVWGVEHGLLSTGDEEAYLRHTTLEEQAAEYAHMLIAAMAAKGRRLLHLFGGSFDGLCAQKAHPHPPSPAAHPLCTPRARPPLSHPCLGTQVGVALRERSSPPGVVFLVDPPPPGPCSIEAVELCNDRAVGVWAVRAGHIAEGLAADEVDMAQIAALFAPCNSLSECAYVATAELVKLPGQSLLAAQVCPLLRRRALLPGRGCTVCPQSAPWSPQSTLVSAGAVRRRALHGAAHPDLPQAHGWRHAT